MKGDYSLKILATDQASKVTGWSLFQDDKLVAHGKIDLHDMDCDTSLRVRAMAKSIFALIDQYRPDKVIIEDNHLKNNAATMLLLANLGGMIMGYCLGNGIQVDKILPKVWRSVLNYSNVKGKALKQLSIDNVQSWYGVDVGEDEAEAICIGRAAYVLNTKNN